MTPFPSSNKSLSCFYTLPDCSLPDKRYPGHCRLLSTLSHWLLGGGGKHYTCFITPFNGSPSTAQNSTSNENSQAPQHLLPPPQTQNIPIEICDYLGNLIFCMVWGSQHPKLHSYLYSREMLNLRVLLLIPQLSPKKLN